MTAGYAHLRAHQKGGNLRHLFQKPVKWAGSSSTSIEMEF